MSPLSLPRIHSKSSKNSISLLIRQMNYFTHWLYAIGASTVTPELNRNTLTSFQYGARPLRTLVASHALLIALHWEALNFKALLLILAEKLEVIISGGRLLHFSRLSASWRPHFYFVVWFSRFVPRSVKGLRCIQLTSPWRYTVSSLQSTLHAYISHSSYNIMI